VSGPEDAREVLAAWAAERDRVRAGIKALARGGHFGAAAALERAFERIDSAFLHAVTGKAEGGAL